MALVHRKRINSTLTFENYDFITKLSKDTGLNQSKIFDLSIEILKDELHDSNILDLINKYNNENQE